MSRPVQLHRTYHLPRLGEMRRLFWERSFDSVASDLVSIFIPVYLLRLHYSATHVFLFYALVGVVMTVAYPIAFKSIEKLSANRTMVIGNLANACFFLLLLSLTHHRDLLWLAAVSRALYSALYFPAFTINFVQARAHQHTGAQVSTLNAITLVLNGLGPAIGGFLASGFGLGWVYAVVIALIILANLPLLIKAPIAQKISLNWRAIPWQAKRDFLANGFYNIPGFVETTLWPMLISIFVVSYAGIGVLSSVMIVSSIIISLYVGRKEDVVGERPFINQGVASNLLGNFGKLIATTPAGIIGVNFVSGTSDALLANSFTSRYYKNADTEQLLGYTLGMEAAHALAWTLFFLALTVLSIVFSLKVVLLVGIALAVPAVFGIRLIKI